MSERRTFTGYLVRDSEKARLLANSDQPGGAQMWLPKSVMTYYRGPSGPLKPNTGLPKVAFEVEGWKIRDVEAVFDEE